MGRTLFVVVLAACHREPDGKPPPAPTTDTTPFVDLHVDIEVCAAENGPFTADVDNPYLPFVVGSVHVLEGLEGGSEFATFQVTVLDETADVGGVTARVVEKSEPGGGGTPERAYYAQAPDGTVCLVGEDEESDGALEFEAGVDGSFAGVFMPGTPVVGMTYEQVRGPDGVEAAEITHVGEPTVTPAGTFDDTVIVLEDGPSLKKYARGIGEIYDDGVELVSY